MIESENCLISWAYEYEELGQHVTEFLLSLLRVWENDGMSSSGIQRTA